MKRFEIGWLDIYIIYMGERYEKWYLVTKNDCATRQRTG